MRATSGRFEPLPMRSTAGSIGSGRRTAVWPCTHGWTPERGFLRYRWEGYSEAILLVCSRPGITDLSAAGGELRGWTRTYRWKKLYGLEFLYAGPLFIHQLSHVWIDFRGIQDDYMRDRGIDYFENSRRATFVQQQYAIRNPRRFRDYGDLCWGITASDGPGPATRRIDGSRAPLLRLPGAGLPFGPDDGTVAPWAVVASLPFAPEIVMPTIRHFIEAYPEMSGRVWLDVQPQPHLPERLRDMRRLALGIPLRTRSGTDRSDDRELSIGLPWEWMKRCPYLVTGLRRAGFAGGWLATNA